MNDKLTRLGIVLKPQNTEQIINLLPNLFRWLNRRKCEVSFLEKEEERIADLFTKSDYSKTVFFNEKNFFIKNQLILSLGGDGTLIGLSRTIPNHKPIFGINRGHLGFITEFSSHQFYDSLQEVLQGQFSIEKKPLFSVEIQRNGKTLHKKRFFNDAVITKNDIARMFALSIWGNDEHIYDLSGDGLIVSSPIGSTAYSLAAGGPIVNPQVKALILTPISPHSLSYRPLVIDDKTKLKIKLLDFPTSVILTLDGQEAINLEASDTVIITKHRKNISFVKNPLKKYYRTLKEKFGHGLSQTQT